MPGLLAGGATMGPKRGLLVMVWRLRRATRRYGLAGTIREALRLLRTRRAGEAARKRSLDFDRRHGTDTAGIVRLGALEIESPNRDLGVRYQPSDPEDFRSLVEALPFDLTDYVFVDLGSGKGRILLLASEFPFRGVVGVEFAHELNEVAERNIALSANHRRRCHDVRTVTADAAEYVLPEGPLVLYLYNPFAPEILRRILEHNRGSLESGSRPVYVLITGARELVEVLEGAGFERLRSGGEGEGRGIFAFADAPGARARPKSEPRAPEGECFDGQDIEHIGKNNWSDSRRSWTSAPARPSRLLRIAIKLHLVVPEDSYWDWEDGPNGEM
jgi:SAM-dependent methyltransferase